MTDPIGTRCLLLSKCNQRPGGRVHEVDSMCGQCAFRRNPWMIWESSHRVVGENMAVKVLPGQGGYKMNLNS